MSFPGVAVIIGAGSGIGQATARLYAQRGCAKIALGDVDPKGLVATRHQVLAVNSNIEVLDIQCDIASEESINAFIAQTVAKFGRIDYACNIAGILMYGTTTEFSAANFDTQWNINGRGTWLCQRAELTQMAKQDPIRGEEDLYYQRGSIVNMSSMAGLRGYEMLPSYCATKHAINGFTKSDALRVASDGIRINAVCPGVIKTSLLKETEEGDQSSMDLLVSETHMKRLGHPEEVAEAVLFLTSGKSSFITATTLSVNGGMIGS